MLLRSGYIHKAPDEFSTSWKFVHLGATFKWNHLNCTKIYMSGHSKFPKTKWKYWTVPCEQCGWSNFAASQKFETMNTFLVSIPMFNRPQQEVSELFEPKWRQPLLFLHCTLYSLTGNVKSNIVKNTKIKKLTSDYQRCISASGSAIRIGCHTLVNACMSPFTISCHSNKV